MKKTFPAFLTLCFLTSGCAEMSQYTTWPPKWLESSAENQTDAAGQNEDGKTGALEESDKKLSYWKQVEGWEKSNQEKPSPLDGEEIPPQTAQEPAAENAEAPEPE